MPPRRFVEETRQAVETSRGDQFVVGANRDRVGDRADADGALRGSGDAVPHPHRAVGACRDELLAVLAEGEFVDGDAVAVLNLDALAVLRIPPVDARFKSG